MAEDETDEVPKLPPDARLESLDERLERLQQAEAKRTYVKPVDPNYRLGNLVLGNLIGAPIGGALVGWGLDSLFGTFPWLLLLMLFFGFGVCIRNVFRIANSSSGKTPGSGY